MLSTFFMSCCFFLAVESRQFFNPGNIIFFFEVGSVLLASRLLLGWVLIFVTCAFSLSLSLLLPRGSFPKLNCGVVYLSVG